MRHYIVYTLDIVDQNQQWCKDGDYSLAGLLRVMDIEDEQLVRIVNMQPGQGTIRVPDTDNAIIRIERIA